MDTTSLWFVLAGVAAIYAWRAFGPGRRAPIGQIVTKIAAGALIIDVRTPGEFKGGSYPKARNIPLDRLSSNMDSIGAKDRPIVVFCASGSRSSQAAAMLRKAGFTDVNNAGGLVNMPR